MTKFSHALKLFYSRLFLLYFRKFTLDIGKWRLFEVSSRFLVAPIGEELFVRLSDTSDAVEVAIARHGALEPETVRAFLLLLSPQLVVFDVGANIGQYTLLASRRVVAVHAFEPTPRTVEKLRVNIALNNLSNVTVNQVAVSDRTGDAILFTDPKNPDTNSIMGGNENAPSISVPTITLDDYATSHALIPDLIKMDIEGAEMLALRGATRLLNEENAPLILMEINPAALRQSGSSPDEILTLLASLGYTYHPLASYGHGQYGNGIAMKPSHRQRFAAIATLTAR